PTASNAVNVKRPVRSIFRSGNCWKMWQKNSRKEMNKMKTSKQVLVIEGSPRKHGNTGFLSDEFIKGAEEAGHATEKIYLSEKNIGYCVDCEVCQTEGGGCAKKDDFQEIKDK